jgi:hypothetical protein
MVAAQALGIPFCFLMGLPIRTLSWAETNENLPKLKNKGASFSSQLQKRKKLLHLVPN